MKNLLINFLLICFISCFGSDELDTQILKIKFNEVPENEVVVIFILKRMPIDSVAGDIRWDGYNGYFRDPKVKGPKYEIIEKDEYKIGTEFIVYPPSGFCDEWCTWREFVNLYPEFVIAFLKYSQEVDSLIEKSVDYWHDFKSTPPTKKTPEEILLEEIGRSRIDKYWVVTEQFLIKNKMILNYP